MPAKLSYNSKKVFICAFGDYHLNKNGKSGILKKLENPDFPFL